MDDDGLPPISDLCQKVKLSKAEAVKMIDSSVKMDQVHHKAAREAMRAYRWKLQNPDFDRLIGRKAVKQREAYLKKECPEWFERRKKVAVERNKRYYMRVQEDPEFARAHYTRLMLTKERKFRYSAIWKCTSPPANRDLAHKVDQFCKRLEKFDLLREMRLRVKETENFKEFCDSDRDLDNEILDKNAESDEDLCQKASTFRELREMMKKKKTAKLANKDQGQLVPE